MVWFQFALHKSFLGSFFFLLFVLIIFLFLTLLVVLSQLIDFLYSCDVMIRINLIFCLSVCIHPFSFVHVNVRFCRETKLVWVQEEEEGIKKDTEGTQMHHLWSSCKIKEVVGESSKKWLSHRTARKVNFRNTQLIKKQPTQSMYWYHYLSNDHWILCLIYVLISLFYL